MPQDHIEIRGARQNNLKNLDLNIPLNRMTVISGVSGSGKSSLAFDTLYAEGQRRYVETFSPYARQFMDRMDRPKVERISGALETMEGRAVPQWLEIEKDEMKGTIKAMPQREDVTLPIDEQLIVELYSR